MSPYCAFKRCLIDAWPNGQVQMCAAMILLDLGERWNPMACENFIRTFHMPYAYTQVSVYLAAFYPRTSAALFGGRSKADALAIFIKEKHTRVPGTRMKDIARAQFREENQTRYIRLRSLSKWHDWHTVK